jgi:hypothetical protein
MGLRGRDGRRHCGSPLNCARGATCVQAQGVCMCDGRACDGGCVQRPWVRKEPVGVTGLRGRNGRARGTTCVHAQGLCMSDGFAWVQQTRGASMSMDREKDAGAHGRGVPRACVHNGSACVLSVRTTRGLRVPRAWMHDGDR